LQPSQGQRAINACQPTGCASFEENRREVFARRQQKRGK
jgi:hypothetical protein